MSDQIPEQRLAEILAELDEGQIEVEGSNLCEGEGVAELRALVAEVRDRRRQAGYSREQRLTFLLRLVKDSFPEVANDLRALYSDMNNDIYYSRREGEYWKRQSEKETAHLRSCLRDAMAFIDPDVAGDYKLWKEALDD